MATTVNVKNISASTDDKEIRNFFSFCGKITDINVTDEGATKSADVTFEKETAAKTAHLLNGTTLNGNALTITSRASPSDDNNADGAAASGERDTDEITQEEKPRARILAEYLANGYLVADTGLKKAIQLDEKHGVTQRFLSTLQNLDQKYHATDRAKTADESYGITQRATSLFAGLGSYFEKATNTPTGKKIHDFYTQSTRQVTDIHSEAKRLAELKKQEHGGSAYKASGLEKIFGKEKTEESSDSSAKAPDASTSATLNADQQPIAASNVPQGGEVPEKLPGSQ